MSLEKEDRKCCCNNDKVMNNTQNNSTMTALNTNWNMNDVVNTSDMCNCLDSCDSKREVRAEMLHKIKCLDFAIQELALYLDTHPDDEKALFLHNKYCKEYRELTDKYQKVYGPLTINYPCNKWRWLEEPWGSFYLGVVKNLLE